MLLCVVYPFLFICKVAYGNTRAKVAILRGTVIGFFVGVLPGAGATLASFLSYDIEKRVSKHPERFGKGEIRGVASPESANNAASGGALLPMLTLGIPGGGATAVMLGAFMMLGIRPGPLLFQNHPDLVWGLIASMYLGNLVLLALNWPLVNLFARIMYIPARYLMPIVLVISTLGVCSLGHNYGRLRNSWILHAQTRLSACASAPRSDLGQTDGAGFPPIPHHLSWEPHDLPAKAHFSYSPYWRGYIFGTALSPGEMETVSPYKGKRPKGGSLINTEYITND